MQPIDNPEKRLLETPVPSLKDGLHRDTLKQSLLAEMQKERVMAEKTGVTIESKSSEMRLVLRRRNSWAFWLAAPAIVTVVVAIVVVMLKPDWASTQRFVQLAAPEHDPIKQKLTRGNERAASEVGRTDSTLTVDSERVSPSAIAIPSLPPGPESRFRNLGPKKDSNVSDYLGWRVVRRIPEIAKAEFATGDNYAPVSDNPFHKPAQSPLSTFSIDVDTASYTNVRRFLLQEKQLPPKDAVRIEELINYFPYDDPQPEAGKPVAIKAEVGPCPWNGANRLVRIGLRAKSVPAEQSPPRNLVFLVDTSGSMMPADRLPLLKQGLQMLVGTLRPEDRVAIVAYAGSAGLVLPSTAGNNKNEILAALGRLESGGSTNGGQGIELAYSIAQEHFIKDGVNRVILGTDGDFNVGITSQGDLVRLIEEKRKTGVFLSILGFGHGNLKDATMEKLAHHGNGHYAYIDNAEEAHRIFVEQGAALQVVAGDVKVQVEFNPARVAAYRLVGYENRLMKHEDFNDDKKDAGDMGSGHTVTALYEIVLIGGEANVPGVDPLRYQDQPAPVPLKDTAKSSELMMVKVRYKDPGAEVSKLLTQPVVDARKQLPETSVDFRFAAAVAEFALILRASPHKGTANIANVVTQSRGAIGPDFHGHRAAFVQMAEAARQLVR